MVIWEESSYVIYLIGNYLFKKEINILCLIEVMFVWYELNVWDLKFYIEVDFEFFYRIYWF